MYAHQTSSSLKLERLLVQILQKDTFVQKVVIEIYQIKN